MDASLIAHLHHSYLKACSNLVLGLVTNDFPYPMFWVKQEVLLLQVDVNEKELTALKAVVKCIEDHKLEEQFPVDPLHKQVLEIEKAKADKKRATEVSKPDSKRPRANVRVAEKNCFHGGRYPQYIYERPYAYTEHQVPSFPTYNFSPSHGNFFPNPYQYQTAYLH